MHALALYRLEVQPHAGQSPRDCAEEICNHYSKFIVQYYRNAQKEVLPLRFDGRTDQPANGHSLVSSRLVCADHTLATVDWHIRVPEDGYYTWRISFDCATDRRHVELQYRTEVGLRTLLVTSGKVEMQMQLDLIMPSEFLSAVLGIRTATVDAWPVPVAVEFLGPREVDRFVDRILLNPKRVLPVVLLAADGRFKSTPASMQNLQRTLLGAAHLAALINPSATEQLTRRLGANLACTEGVLRVYYPQLTLKSLPRDHPVIHPEDLRNKDLDATLHMKAMRFLLERVPDGPVINAARAAVGGELAKYSEQFPSLMTHLSTSNEKLRRMEAQHERIQADRDEARRLQRSMEGKLAEQIHANSLHMSHMQTTRAKLETSELELEKLRTEHSETLQRLGDQEQHTVQLKRQLDILREKIASEAPTQASTGAGELEDELDHAWRENEQALADLESARQEIAALEAELDICKRNLEILASTPMENRFSPVSAPLAPKPLPIPISVIDALRQASERHGDILVIWEDAWRSAKESHFSGTTRVADALTAIADIGRNYFAAVRQGQSLGPIDRAFRQKVPFKYAPCESNMTMAMYGQERLFHDGNLRREIQRHLTLGGRGNCLQVYFDFDESSQKVIIAYCGQHLSHFRQT